jgi:hypothetical protein
MFQKKIKFSPNSVLFNTQLKAQVSTSRETGLQHFYPTFLIFTKVRAYDITVLSVYASLSTFEWLIQSL